MCEFMWDDSFEVVDDETKGYDMWFFGSSNPNDAVSAKLNLSGADEKCFLGDYNHKDSPTPEPLNGECGAYRNGACCKASVVPDLATVKNIYGAAYHWDRCGPLSRQCEAFFVQEACFYECDANNGYWRLYRDEQEPLVDENRITYIPECNERDETVYDDINEDGKSPTGEQFIADNPTKCAGGHNRWQLHKAPIKKSYCDAWYAACQNDLFCGVRDGSYFACAGEYEEAIKVKNVTVEVEVDKFVEVEVDTLSTGSIVGICVGVILGVVMLGLLFLVIKRERSGKPIFLPVNTEEETLHKVSQEDLEMSKE